jgi:hypothetical protein
MRGAGAAAKAAASSEKLVGGIAGIAEKQALSAGAKALQFGKEVVIDAAVGGAANAINSAAAAAMDPENRRQGKSGQQAFESGLRSFLGGAVGSSLTKPFGALAKPAGKMVERVAGTAAGGFATRLTEARVGQAMGEPHQSWAESLEQAKEGIAQDVIQGAAEHGAEHFAERRAKTRAQHAARAGGEPPVPVVTRSPEEAPLAMARPAAPAEGPQHAPQPLARAAAVREALPPDLLPAVEAALPPRPGATEPIRPVAPPGTEEAGLAAAHRAPGESTEAEPVTERRSATPPDEAHPVTRGAGAERGSEPTHAPKKATVQHADIPWAPANFLEGAVMMDDNSHSRAEIEQAYRKTIAADPSREVAIYRNPETGEHIMVFGDADSVFIGLNRNFGEAPHAAEPPGTRQDWKELLPKDVGRWELEAHYHPGFEGKHDVAPMARRLPSTGENGVGDFQVLRHESQAAGGGPRSSVIDFTHEGRAGQTVFGFDPDHPKPFWIDVENPSTGAREQHRFATPGEYEGWAQQHGAAPNRDVPAAPRASPLPGATPPHDEELTLRHGTTKEDADAIRAAGIDPHRKSGEAEDFSRGFYMTLDEANARYYAERRSGGTGGEVLSTTIKLSELGLVVDVRDSGAHRRQWDDFLDREPPAYPPWGAGIFKNAREFLTGTGAVRMNEIQRGVVFEAFLAEAGLLHADAIRGDLGRGLTTGLAAHSEGEQLAIRSKELADKLNRRMGFGGAPQEGPARPGSGRAAKSDPTAAREGAVVEQALAEREARPPDKTPVAATEPAAPDAPSAETAAAARARERAERRQAVEDDPGGHQTATTSGKAAAPEREPLPEGVPDVTIEAAGPAEPPPTAGYADHADPVAGFNAATRRGVEVDKELALLNAQINGRNDSIDALRALLKETLSRRHPWLTDLELESPEEIARLRTIANDPVYASGKARIKNAFDEYVSRLQARTDEEPDVRAAQATLEREQAGIRADLEKLRTRLATEVRPYNGVHMTPQVGEPVAGWAYKPAELEGGTLANQLSHLHGFQAELRLTNDIALNRGELVVSWGIKSGVHGADVVSVHPDTGEVTLWDSKYLGDGGVHQGSSTFEGDNLEEARQRALADLRNDARSGHLPPSLRKQAEENLIRGNFRTATISSTEPTANDPYPIKGAKWQTIRDHNPVK